MSVRVTDIQKCDLYCRAVFSRDDEEITKYVRLGNELDDFISDLKRAAKEADRDISIKLTGRLPE